MKGWPLVVAFALLGAMSWLSGCAVMTEQKQPASAPLPAAWNIPAEVTTAAGTIAPDWWRALGDETLDALIDQAQHNNHDLAAATARLREARAMANAAGASLLPRLDLSTTASRQRLSKEDVYPLPPSHTNPFGLYRAGFDASWELDLFGANTHERDSAVFQAQSTLYRREDFALSLSAEVAASYIRLRGARVQGAALGHQIELARETLKLVEVRNHAGLVNDLDRLQATEMLSSLESGRADYDSAEQIEIRRLATLTGLSSRDLDNRLIAASVLSPEPPGPPMAVPAALLERRPDLRAVEQSLMASVAQAGSAAAARYPHLGLIGGLGSLTINSSDLFSAPTKIWNAGLRVTLPLWDPAIGPRIDAANARLDQAVAAYAAAASRAVEEVETSAIRLHQTHRQIHDLETACAAATDSADLAAYRYRLGLIDLLPVLDAQRRMYALQSRQLAATETALTQWIALNKALGGGWRLEPRMGKPAA
ncbi:efflux transporter outer membrane subunit [Dyella tabacisoli]|uniref:RND transporter n=1 Tax=Dyella tabacisoli TaxID=2282381 RepID=A0A369UL61_9GAMM|nr:efflux transporter outer membrane subunit [Dyella tabacisoli]RDD81306.1 hypothetical protein DVJ77_13440 [Dyella tabacisoli]